MNESQKDIQCQIRFTSYKDHTSLENFIENIDTLITLVNQFMRKYDGEVRLKMLNLDELSITLMFN